MKRCTVRGKLCNLVESISLNFSFEENAKQENGRRRRLASSVIVSVIGFLMPASFGTFPGSFFDPENRGIIFLRNVDISPNYTASQPKRLCFLYLPSSELQIYYHCNSKKN
jgi:hypothetical protein